MKLLALLGAGALAAEAIVAAVPAAAQYRSHVRYHRHDARGHGYGGGYRRAYYGRGPRWGGRYRHCRVYRSYHHPARRCY